MAATFKISVHEANIDGLTSWNSEFGRKFLLVSKEAAVAARTHVPQEYSQTGVLRASIGVADKGRNKQGLWTKIGSKRSYALFIDQGTMPHIIRPKKPGGRLVFYWRWVGHVVSMKSVHHPGTRPYHYLERGVNEAFHAWLGH